MLSHTSYDMVRAQKLSVKRGAASDFGHHCTDVPVTGKVAMTPAIQGAIVQATRFTPKREVGNMLKKEDDVLRRLSNCWRSSGKYMYLKRDKFTHADVVVRSHPYSRLGSMMMMEQMTIATS